MAKPQYITDLESRIGEMEQRQTEFRITVDSVLVNQADLKRSYEGQTKTLTQIHFLLGGTDYDKNNGGLVGEIDKMKRKIHNNTVWRIRITAAGTAVAGAVSFFLVKLGAIINNLKELINK